MKYIDLLDKYSNIINDMPISNRNILYIAPLSWSTWAHALYVITKDLSSPSCHNMVAVLTNLEMTLTRCHLN